MQCKARKIETVESNIKIRNLKLKGGEYRKVIVRTHIEGRRDSVSTILLSENDFVEICPVSDETCGA